MCAGRQIGQTAGQAAFTAAAAEHGGAWLRENIAQSVRILNVELCKPDMQNMRAFTAQGGLCKSLCKMCKTLEKPAVFS